jgi:hypothetical protein
MEGVKHMGLFGSDKMTIALEKYDYTPGEKIKGTISLNLKKPRSARSLEIALIGRRVSKQTNAAVLPMMMGNSKGYKSSTSYQTVYKFKLPVDGEKEYQNEQYSFEIPIPEDIVDSGGNLNEKMQGATQAIKMLAGYSTRVDWIVFGQLDVPKGLDIKDTQKIVLSTK